MTKKHFEDLASILQYVRLDRPINVQDAIDMIESGIITMCKRYNSNFDIDKFKSAAGNKFRGIQNQKLYVRKSD